MSTRRSKDYDGSGSPAIFGGPSRSGSILRGLKILPESEKLKHEPHRKSQSRQRGRPGAGKPVNTIADRKSRHAFALKCAEVADEMLKFKLETFRNTALPHVDRDRAADWIIDRAFGRVPMPVETPSEAPSKIIYECRWLPPDPSDNSNVIEPTQGLV